MNSNYNPFDDALEPQQPQQPQQDFVSSQEPIVQNQPEVLEESQNFQTAPEVTNTNDLNKLNTTAEAVNEEVKEKKPSKLPIIMIVLLFLVGLGFGGFFIAYQQGLFEDKKGSSTPTFDENLSNEVEEPEQIFYTSDGSQVKFSDYSAVETSIKNTVQVVQKDSKFYNTLKENPATLRFDSGSIYYALEKQGDLLRITKYNPAAGGAVGTAKEIYRKTIPAVDYTFPNGRVGKVSPSLQGYVSGNYVLMEITHAHKVGETVLMDKSFNVIQQHYHDSQNYPLATETAIYYGVINCKGRKSNYEEGPVIETYMLNTTSGEKKYLYNIDYKNETNYCKK